MSESRPDQELEALERRLDSMFEAAPEPGFREELAGRLSIGRRRRHWGSFPGITLGRLAPVLAAVLLVGGAGLYLSHRPGPLAGGSGSLASTGAGHPAAAAFGRLPAPPVGPGAGGRSAAGSAEFGSGSGKTAAPALTAPRQAPVYRFKLLTRADADRFAASLGATRAATTPAGALGLYRGPGFSLTVRRGNAALGLPPTAAFTGSPPQGVRLRLTVPAAAVVGSGGQTVEDAFPLQLTASPYPLRAAPAPATAGASPGGSLAKVVVAYTAVYDGGWGYLEPVYLLTDASGAARAVAPAVVPSDLRR